MRRSGIDREEAVQIVVEMRARLAARVRELAETDLVALVACAPWGPAAEAALAAAADAALDDVLAEAKRALAAAAVPRDASELDA